MPIKLEMLRYFVAVAQSGNLVDAAKKLSRTPSAVSMMLKQFEDHLGAALFESERKSKLTALGAFTLAEAVREVEHFEQTVTAITSFARSESGLVRIAAVPSVASAILPKVMKKFLVEHPNVSVDIRDMDSKGVHRELEKERIDIGIATGTGTGLDIKSEKLFSDAFGIVCPIDHPLTEASSPLSWGELAPWPFIANGLCLQISDQAFQSILSTSQLMVRNTTSLLALVCEGVGVTVVPRLVIDSSDHDLAFLPVADPSARRSIEILRRVETGLSPAAQSFESAIRFVVQEIIERMNQVEEHSLYLGS